MYLMYELINVLMYKLNNKPYTLMYKLINTLHY
jgi:hypothetical protein